MSHFIPRNKLTKLITQICTPINETKDIKQTQKYTVPTETIQILQLFGEKFIAEIFDKSKKICLLKGEENISKNDVQYVLEEIDIIFGNKKVWNEGIIPSKDYIDKYNDAPKY